MNIMGTTGNKEILVTTRNKETILSKVFTHRNCTCNNLFVMRAGQQKCDLEVKVMG